MCIFRTSWNETSRIALQLHRTDSTEMSRIETIWTGCWISIQLDGLTHTEREKPITTGDERAIGNSRECEESETKAHICVYSTKYVQQQNWSVIACFACSTNECVQSVTRSVVFIGSPLFFQSIQHTHFHCEYLIGCMYEVALTMVHCVLRLCVCVCRSVFSYRKKFTESDLSFRLYWIYGILSPCSTGRSETSC